RGSLLFISRRHVEVKFPTRALALGNDEEKDGRWVDAHNNIIRRLKSSTVGVRIDLSYEREVFALFPDASYQTPATPEEKVNAVEEEFDARP
ncbi:unnamed protein product, partial [Amoebophrya sp. A120]